MVPGYGPTFYPYQARSVTGITTTNNSPTLTGPAGSFNANDVGQYVAGANLPQSGTTVPAQAKITAVNANGSQATMSLNANSTVGGGGETVTVSDRTIAGAATTSGSTALTAAAGNFTSADLGQAVSGTGIPTGDTIAAVNSATSITLSAAATATGTVPIILSPSASAAQYCLLGTPVGGLTLDAPTATQRYTNAGVSNGHLTEIIIDAAACAANSTCGPSQNGTTPDVMVYLNGTQGTPRSGTLETTVPEPANLPPTVKFGWAASTGGSNEIHEINDVSVYTQVPIYPLLCAEAGADRLVQGTTVTSGSATMTGATGSFSSADVGKPIYGTGIPIGTTIVSVAGSTSATMSNSATATNTGTVTVSSVPGSASRTITNAGVTNGSKTLTDPAGSFTQADVGQVVAGTGIPLLTTIASVQSATSATMSVAATTTATEAVTLSTGATQTSCGNTQTALPATTGTVAYPTFRASLLSTGSNETQPITATITLPSGVQFVAGQPPSGSGWVCPTPGAGVTTVVCTFTPVGSVNAGVALPAIVVPVQTTNPSATGTFNIPMVLSSSDNSAPASDLTATQPITWGGTAGTYANVSIVKTASNPAPANGAAMSYTITATNPSSSTASALGVVVTDPLPQGVGYVSASSATGSVTEAVINGVPTVTWTVGTMAINSSAALTINVLIDVGGGSVVNTAVESQTNTNLTGNQTASSTILPTPVASVSVLKTVTTTTPANGGSIIYTLTVVNGGPNTANSTVVSDPLPAGLGLVSWGSPAGTSPTTASGQATTVTSSGNTVTWNMGNLSAGDGASLVITATVNATNIRSTAAATVTNGSATLTDTGAAFTTADIGDPVIGPGIPTGTTITAVGSGTSVTMSNNATASSTGQVAVTGAITNTAYETQSASTPNASGGNTSQGSVNIYPTPVANVTISKVASPITGVTGGTAVTYTIKVTNNGPDTALGVNVTDPLPTQVTETAVTPPAGTQACYRGANRTVYWGLTANCTGPTVAGFSLAAGASLTMTISVTANATPGTFTNTATEAQSSATPNVTGVQIASATVNGAVANVVVTKTVDNPTPANGANVTFTLTVTNNGPTAAAGVSVADPLPSGLAYVSNTTPSVGTATQSGNAVSWTIGTLANNASASMQITATVTVANQRTATGVVVTSGSAALTAPTGTFSAADVGARITGTGIPAGTTIQSVASGTSATMSGNATGSATESVQLNGQILNTAVETQTTPNASGGTTTSASAAVWPTAVANVTFTKTVSNSTPQAGAAAPANQTTYTLTATNNGPNTAAGIVVTDPLPAGVSYSSLGTAPAGTQACYNAGSLTVTWGATCSSSGSPAPTGFSLANGSTLSLTITVTATATGTITNTATETQATPNSSGATSQQASVPITPTGTANLIFTKVVSNPTPTSGSQDTYTLQVHNNGPFTALGVNVTDPLPAGVSYVSATPTPPAGSTVSEGTVGGVPTVGWSIPSIANGATYSLAIVVQITAFTGTFNNLATETQSPLTPNSNGGTSQTAQAAFTIQWADVTGTKALDATTPGPFHVGDTAIYDVTVANSASSNSSTAVSITDVLPAGVTYSSATITPAGACTPTNSAGTVSCNNLTLAAGASATLKITVTVASAPVGGNTATWTQTVPSDTGATTGITNTVTPTVNYANVTVAKSLDATTPGPFHVGDTLTYDVVATNSASSTSATNVSLSDVLPAGVSYTSAAITPAGACTPTNTAGTVTCNSIPLASGGSATFKITVTITSAPVGANTATWTQSVPSSSGTTTGSSNAVTPTVNYANVTVVKSLDATTPGPFQVGQTVIYDIAATNSASSTVATNVSLSDVLPAGVSYSSATITPAGACTPTNTAGTITCNNIALAIGGSATLKVTATITSTTPGPNTATWTQTIPSSTGVTSGSAGPVTPPVNFANVTVVKSLDATTPGPFHVGDTLIYDVAATNSASSNSATNVSLSDVLPAGVSYTSAAVTPAGACTPTNTAGTVTCNNIALAVGSTATLKVTVKVTSAPVGSNAATWTQTVASSTGSTTGTSNSVTPTVNYANVTVTKALDATTPGPFQVGQSAIYDVAATNSASSTVATSVSLSDVLPTGVSYTSAAITPAGACTPTNTAGTVTCNNIALAVGATATLKITVTITSAPVGSNTATWTQTVPSSTGVTSGSAGPVTTPVNYANVTVAKSLDATTPGPFHVGDTLTYDVVATNSASSTSATNVSLSDVLPAGVSYTSAAITPAGACTPTNTAGTVTCNSIALAIGGSATLKITVTITSAPVGANSATWTQSVPSSTGSTSGTSNAVTPTVNYANVTVVKSLDATTPGPFQVGSTLTYDVTATNSASSTVATTVSLSDLLPAGVSYTSAAITPAGACTPTNTAGTVTCNNVALAVGGSATLKITVTITSAPVGANSATWTQTVPSTTGSTSGTSNAVTPTVNYANVTVVKSLDATTPGPFHVGDTLIYDIVATNSAGSTAATNVSLSDVLPAGVSYVSSSSSACTPAQAGGTVTCTVNGLAVGASATLKITVTVTAPVVGPNAATWTSSIPSSSGSTSGTSNTVTPTVNYANVTVVKSLDATTPGPFQVGSTLTYDVTATNSATSTVATTVNLSDVLPAGVAFSSATITPAGACTPTITSGTVTCNNVALAIGGAATLKITVTITSAPVGANSATWTQSVPSSTGSTSGTSNTVTPTVNYANVTVVKSIDASTPGPFQVGSTLTYDVTATNSGGSTSATNVTLSDVLPAGVTFVSSSSASCTPSQASGTVTCTVSGLAVGATATLKITVTIAAGVVGPNNATYIQSVPSSTGSTSGTSNTVNVPVNYANVTVVKSIDASTPGPFQVGSTLTYDVTATNSATSTSATNVSLSDVLPAGVAFSSATITPAGACTPTNTAGTVTCNNVALAIGGSATLKITVTITAGVVGPNSATWTQSVPSSTGQTSGTSNTVNVPVNYANVTVVKSIDASTPGPFQVGSTLTYDVTATNSAWVDVRHERHAVRRAAGRGQLRAPPRPLCTPTNTPARSPARSRARLGAPGHPQDHRHDHRRGRRAELGDLDPVRAVVDGRRPRAPRTRSTSRSTTPTSRS